MSQRGLRLAAVHLAALHASDRFWLLQQLPPAQAAILRELLGSRELKAWARHIDGDLEIPSPDVAPMPSASPLPPALRSLGPAWTALWLKAHEPSAIETRLADMESRRAQRVLDEMMNFDRQLPPALRDALLRWPARTKTFAELL
jgi:hypothetical protein